MKKSIRMGGTVIATLAVLLVLAFVARHHLLPHIVALTMDLELKPAADELGAEWFDEYFTVFRIDDRTFAIGETRYWQNNFNYLIVGDEMAVLFDAGPGIRDIRPVIRSLTSLPVLFIPSHLHYDHLGNSVVFDRLGIIDVPHLRGTAKYDGEHWRLLPEWLQHQGTIEGIEAPTLTITRWLTPGSDLELGNRLIQVVYTPGHTPDSVSLVDFDSGYAFTGDFLVPGPLSEFTYGGNMGDYLQGANALVNAARPSGRVFGAHRPILAGSPGVAPGMPELQSSDILDLRNALTAIRDGDMPGRGPFPVIYTINDNVELWANMTWMQEWSPRYPQFATGGASTEH